MYSKMPTDFFFQALIGQLFISTALCYRLCYLTKAVDIINFCCSFYTMVAILLLFVVLLVAVLVVVSFVYVFAFGRKEGWGCSDLVL